MNTVVVLGTLDTKGEEHAYLASRIRARGLRSVLVDTGILGAPVVNADVAREEVAAAAGTSIATLVAAGDRATGIEAMARGAATVLQQLHDAGDLDAVVALGGGSGTTLAATAMRTLPVGVPKLIVTTLASGNTRPIVRGSDLMLMHSVLDIAGLNQVTREIIDNAAAAVSGAAQDAPDDPTRLDQDRPLIGATMFGVTTHAVDAARTRLEAAGYSVLVFAAVGSGGEALEALIRSGHLVGVLDLTTTELVDDLVGGVMSAGPNRLTAAADAGVPQVVSVGAMDMANLGPLEDIQPAFRKRNLHQHAPTMTLMRTTIEENRELGRRIAQRVSASHAPSAVFLPIAGVSAIDRPGSDFGDPEADGALFAAIRSGLEDHVALRELPLNADDPAFGEAMADWLIAAIHTFREGKSDD
ncbi:UPF0261 family protein [Curtobacterium sp. MCBD17_034]|nr:Tm-1-like ATP-binding domain-containing protein [Curtobacterium sp. MCBD17_034]PZF62619.1 UPF0261 family protein [Curtobacterium sp. MCBD17_034]PZM34113.1 UPF0261 family protein [Curtobacterium sp. MCBD17_031]